MSNSTPQSAEIVDQDEPRKSELPLVTAADLPDSWRKAMNQAGWNELMPVQAKAMPYVMAGRDVMVQSRTGSGKTGAFIMPILERINPLLDECQALVLVPTRELAKQVAKEADMLTGERDVRTVEVYGGVGYREQLQAFKKGAHLVVGTPGRVLDHLLKRSLSLDHLKILVFDEADRLLSMGFYPDMQELQRYLPADRVDSFMFSATFPTQVLSLARQFLHEPELLSLSLDHVHVADTEHVFYTAPGMDKDRGLVRLIEVENPTSAIIFCNTKARVHYVAVVLRRFGHDADELSSDLTQSAREKVMDRVRKGKLRFLVATDVAARGIDISALSHVIQFETPEDPEGYIHRAGRTGRAGAAGKAISIVDVLERARLLRIARQFEIDMQELELPTDEDVAEIVTERVTAMLEASLRSRDRLQIERMKRFGPLAKSLGDSDDELALITMLLDDYYQKTLHAPPSPQSSSRAQESSKPGPSSGRGGRRKRGRR